MFSLAFALPIKIDAQANPLPALMLAALICVVLWALVQSMNRRERRPPRRRDGDVPPKSR